jgi:cation diffusion facilitator family transporter
MGFTIGRLSFYLQNDIIFAHKFNKNATMNNVNPKEYILIKTSWISTIGNFILSAAKIIIGLFAGSLAVLGDGIDSATDVLISIVAIFTAKIMSRPPSQKYAYGYEKAESIAVKILSLIIFYAGAQMLVSALQNMFSSESKELPNVIAIYVTIFSMVGKMALAYYQYLQGKKIKSSLLTANAINMRNDVLISFGVLIGLLFTFILKLPILDSVTGLIISIFIIKSSISIFMDSNVELMDGVKDVSVYNKIFAAVEKVPGTSNPHRVRSRQIGNMYMIALDIEADGNITLNEAHNIANLVENSIKEDIENIYDIVVHVEPKGVHHTVEKFGINKEML